MNAIIHVYTHYSFFVLFTLGTMQVCIKLCVLCGMCLSVCLSVCVSFCPSVHLCVCMSVCVSTGSPSDQGSIGEVESQCEGPGGR